MRHRPYAAPYVASHVAPEEPMSTASPLTCADVRGVATQRAASASEPYFETACWSSCSWYAGERQPLSTVNRTPAPAASVAARRRAVSRPGSSFATPGIVPSKTVVPSGMAPPASPTPPRGAAGRRSRRGTWTGAVAVGDAESVEDEEAGHS